MRKRERTDGEEEKGCFVLSGRGARVGATCCAYAGVAADGSRRILRVRSNWTTDTHINTD